MRKIIIFFFTLSLVASGILFAAADFGESSPSLGQVTDEFDTLANVSVRVLIERNTTLNAMELNFTTGAFGALEDFSGYTEVDVGGNRVVLRSNTFVEHFAKRNEDTYLYRDYGVNFFTNFTHDFSFNSSYDEAGGLGHVWGLANIVDDFKGVLDANEDSINIRLFRHSSAGNRLVLFELENGNQHTNVWTGPTTNVDYHVRVVKAGAALVVGVYSTEVLRDAGDGTDGDVQNLNLALQNDYNFRYIYAVNTWNDGTDFDLNYDFWNLTLGLPSSAYVNNGYFTTTDQLAGLNGSVLVQLTNTTIPASTGITAEFSSDNSTWVNPTALMDGFQSIDLRDLNWSSAHYVRYNLTGPGTDTPRLYQSRLITTEGAAVAGLGPSVNVSGVWIEYRASAINFTVGTHAGGDLNSTFDIDGDTWNHTEVVGVPGSVISINFTGVDPDAECIWVTIWYLYDGNLNHDYDIEMWNFTSSSWVDDGHIVDGVAFSWVNSTIYAMRIPLDFLNGGEVRVQLNHESPGNINHDLFIDYIRLVAKIPGDPLIVEGGAVAIFPWIAIAIILSLITYLLARER